jgi:hypothetical protein
MAIDTSTYESTLTTKINAATSTSTTPTEFLALSKAVEAIAAPGGVSDINIVSASATALVNALIHPTIVTTSLGPTATAYTLALSDTSKILFCTNTATLTITIPLNSAVAFLQGATIDVVQGGAGKVTIAGASGVTLNSNGSVFSTKGQYALVSVIKTNTTDTWLEFGATGT